MFSYISTSRRFDLLTWKSITCFAPYPPQ